MQVNFMFRLNCNKLFIRCKKQLSVTENSFLFFNQKKRSQYIVKCFLNSCINNKYSLGKFLSEIITFEIVFFPVRISSKFKFEAYVCCLRDNFNHLIKVLAGYFWHQFPPVSIVSLFKKTKKKSYTIFCPLLLKLCDAF